VAVVRRHSEATVTFPDGRARLVASTAGLEITSPFGSMSFAHTGPRYVEVEHADGRVVTVRVRDVDRLARAGLVGVAAFTMVAVRRMRSRR